MTEVHVTSLDGVAQRAESGTHTFVMDEPPPAGADTGPDPYVLVLAALGTCTSMMLRMFARNKYWPPEEVRVDLRYERVHAEDCKDGEATKHRVHRFERVLTLRGPLSDEQRNRLLEIAERCPVHRTLVEPREMLTRLA